MWEGGDDRGGDGVGSVGKAGAEAPATVVVSKQIGEGCGPHLETSASLEDISDPSFGRRHVPGASCSFARRHAAGAAISHLLPPLPAASHLPTVLLDARTRPARGSASALRRVPGRRRRSFMTDPPAKMAAIHAAEQTRPSAQVSEAQLLAGCKRGRAVFKEPRCGTAGWLRLSPASSFDSFAAPPRTAATLVQRQRQCR